MLFCFCFWFFYFFVYPIIVLICDFASFFFQNPIQWISIYKGFRLSKVYCKFSLICIRFANWNFLLASCTTNLNETLFICIIFTDKNSIPTGLIQKDIQRDIMKRFHLMKHLFWYSIVFLPWNLVDRSWCNLKKKYFRFNKNHID